MSANTYIAKLEFSSPLAKGEADLRPDRPPLMGSDTMFSALCHTWAELYGEQSLEEQLQAFGEAPPFLLSSMYVYSPHTYYLPKPLLPPACALPTECAARLRRVHWLPLDYFRAWVQAERIDWAKLLAEEPLGYLRTHAVACRSRTAHDRRFNRVAPFREYCVELAAECGGFVVFRTPSDDIANRLGRCLMFLGEQGIGGRRSTGMGQFAVATGGLIPAPTGWDFMSMDDSRAGVALSLYVPTGDETPRLAETGGYRVCERRGWAVSMQARPPSKKPTLAMLEEGSVVPLPCRGRMADVTPSSWREDGGHAVWRMGMPVVAPLRRSGGQT